jgi:hypothetical protein
MAHSLGGRSLSSRFAFRRRRALNVAAIGVLVTRRLRFVCSNAAKIRRNVALISLVVVALSVDHRVDGVMEGSVAIPAT